MTRFQQEHLKGLIREWDQMHRTVRLGLVTEESRVAWQLRLESLALDYLGAVRQSLDDAQRGRFDELRAGEGLPALFSPFLVIGC